MRPLTRNIVAAYQRATPDQRARGLEWYARANDLARELDPDNVPRAAGVIAALSPQCQWERNAAIARASYLLGSGTGNIYSANNRKASRILRGEDPADVLGGPKVRSFYAGILAPEGTDTVCIDRHAHDIAVGRRTDDATRTASLGTAKGYDAFVRAYQRAAALLGVPASHVQAVTWTVWRERPGRWDWKRKQESAS